MYQNSIIATPHQISGKSKPRNNLFYIEFDENCTVLAIKITEINKESLQ